MIFFVPQNNYFLGDENIFQGWEILYVPKKYETARKAYTNYLKELAAGWVQTACRSSRICTWSRTQEVPNKMNVSNDPFTTKKNVCKPLVSIRCEETQNPSPFVNEKKKHIRDSP